MDRLHEPPRLGDAFGVALLDEFFGTPAGDLHYVERSDGYLDAMHAWRYFAEEARWSAVDRECLARLDGRVLDIGAGAGRVALAAQRRGLDVVALDTSPGAVEVCGARGVVDVFGGTVEDLARDRPTERFDTFVLMGNNMGLLAGPSEAPAFLATLSSMAAPGARVVGTAGHIYKTDNPDHLAYHERNRSLGRMAGQLRLRTRYRSLASEWFDYLFASPEELADVVGAAGWRITDVVEDEGYVYLVELKPE